MWTEAARDALLIQETVKDPHVQKLLLQARVNLELFKHSAEQLRAELEALNNEDFQRTMSSHVTEGIFGADIHTAKMQLHKEHLVGLLITTVTSGHRFTRVIIAARAKDRENDWKNVKTDILILEKHQYHKVRNFMEHLDEAIASGQIDAGLDCSFSREGVLTCKEPNEVFTFDFTEAKLQQPQLTYDKIIEMLKARKDRR